MPVNFAGPGASVRPCVLPRSLAACDFHAVKLLCRQQRQRCSFTRSRTAYHCSTSTSHSVHSVAIQPEALQTVDVSLGDRSYPIYIGQGLLSRSDLLQQHILGKKVLVVTNDTVAPLYLERQVPSSIYIARCSCMEKHRHDSCLTVCAGVYRQLQQEASTKWTSSVSLMGSSTRAWKSCNKCGTKHCKAGLTATAPSLLSAEGLLVICVALLQLPTKGVSTSYRLVLESMEQSQAHINKS